MPPPARVLVDGAAGCQFGEASSHIRREPAPTDKRASVVALTDRGRALAEQVQQLWCGLAEETVRGLPAETVEQIPGMLHTMTGHVDGRRRR